MAPAQRTAVQQQSPEEATGDRRTYVLDTSVLLLLTALVVGLR